MSSTTLFAKQYMLRIRRSRISLMYLLQRELQLRLSHGWPGYNCLALHHGKMMRRLNGATISALKKTVRSLEEQRKGVKDLGNYLVEIAIFSLQVEEIIHILIDDSDILQLEERQISQLHNLLGRVKTLLEWKHPQD